MKKFKQFEFRRNSGFAFAVGHTSWHGVDPVPESAGVRNTLFNFAENVGMQGVTPVTCPIEGKPLPACVCIRIVYAFENAYKFKANMHKLSFAR